ncbi:MAG: formylglycine-generating enzyme family protein [Planctomycetaceae bacterium]|nr:formylglycine-generating enzyme family protein [Planctomycetaceae bacterium]
MAASPGPVARSDDPAQVSRFSALSPTLVNVGKTSIGFAEIETITNSIGMNLVHIPAGEFMMGAADDDLEAREDEKPQHQVRITKPFLMGQYEVTQAEYEKVMGTNPSWFSSTGAGQKKVMGLDTSNFPVDNVSWDDAMAFCAKLSELPAEKDAGRRYRLPTEAEWQYACRAGTTTPFHYGDSMTSTQANINGRFPFGGAPRGPYLGRTTEVGSYEPNAFGLYDMHGNVAEACADWFGREYYNESPTGDPQGPAEGADRIVMGGSWSADAFRCRCTHRRSNATSGAAQYFGFRVVCEQQ